MRITSGKLLMSRHKLPVGCVEKMTRKNIRNSDDADISFDTKTRTVMAKSGADSILEKVKKVQELVQNVSKDNISLALEYYERDVEKTIQAFLEDGAKEALSQWTHSGSKPHTKKKKSKPARQNSPNARPASSSATKGPAAAPSAPKPTQPPPTHSATPAVSTVESGAGAAIEEEVVGAASDEPAQEEKQGTGARHKQHAHQHHHHNYHQHYQNHNPANKSRQRTISEASNSSTMSRGGPHEGLEKSLKDLNRQIISLNRLKTVLKEKAEQDVKDVKDMFKKFADLLMTREVELLFELQKARDQCSDTLSMRQRQAEELRRRVDRAGNMNDDEKAALRLDIKHFVSERKVDEDLSSTQRLVCERQHMEQSIAAFGSVQTPKVAYTQVLPATPTPSNTSTATASSSSTRNVRDRTLSATQSAPAVAVSGAVSQQQQQQQHQQSGGAKVLAQSESLTRYEIQNKDRLTEPRPQYRRPAPHRPAPNRQQQQQQPQQQQNGDDRGNRSTRRRQRQKERQRQIRQQENDQKPTPATANNNNPLIDNNNSNAPAPANAPATAPAKSNARPQQQPKSPKVRPPRKSPQQQNGHHHDVKPVAANGESAGAGAAARAENGSSGAGDAAAAPKLDTPVDALPQRKPRGPPRRSTDSSSEKHGSSSSSSTGPQHLTNGSTAPAPVANGITTAAATAADTATE